MSSLLSPSLPPRLDTLQHQREVMQSELQKSTQKTLTSEEKAHQMDQLLAGEEERVAQLEKELARLRERQVIITRSFLLI